MKYILLLFLLIPFSAYPQYQRITIIPQNAIIATADSLLSLSYIKAKDKHDLKAKIKAYREGVYFVKGDSVSITDVTGLITGILEQVKKDSTGLESTLTDYYSQFGDRVNFKSFFSQEVYKAVNSNLKMQVIIRYRDGDKVKEITIIDTK